METNPLQEIFNLVGQVIAPGAPGSYADNMIMQLCRGQSDGVLVLNPGRLSGVVAVDGSLREMTQAKTPINEPRLREIILRNIIATSPELIAERCQELTRESGVRHLPVVIDGRFLGIISISDLATFVLEGDCP